MNEAIAAASQGEKALFDKAENNNNNTNKNKEKKKKKKDRRNKSKDKDQQQASTSGEEAETVESEESAVTTTSSEGKEIVAVDAKEKEDINEGEPEFVFKKCVHDVCLPPSGIELDPVMYL